MVRIKHRYLLIQILYPGALPTISSSTSPTSSSNPTLALHAPTPDGIHAHALLVLLRDQLSTLFGDHGSSLGGSLSIKYWSAATSTLIVRCARAAARWVWAAATCVRSLSVPAGVARGEAARLVQMLVGGQVREGRGRVEVPCVWRVVRVSGTVRKCEEEAVRRARRICGKVKGIRVAVEAGAGGDFGVEDEEGDVALLEEEQEEDDGEGEGDDVDSDDNG